MVSAKDSPAVLMRWVLISLSLGLWNSEVASIDVIETSVDVSCKNDKEENVDWFILYKLPDGLEYFYMDSTKKKPLEVPSIKEGALVHTLAPMLRSVRQMPPSFGFLSYSDQPPGASANQFGHSKGVVLGDSETKTALWITHTTPQFPFRRDQNSFWPDSGERNGQTFFCVSLPFEALKTVGDHLQNIHAYPFDYDLTDGFPKELKDAAKWTKSDALLGEFQTLETRDKKDLQLMAKPLGEEAEDGDLYAKLAAGLKSDMYAQTWGCQSRAEESFCLKGEKQVLNVEDLVHGSIIWSAKNDHSKWAVSIEKNVAWTCFGDMNRAVSQYERRGGAVCLNDKQVNEVFKGFVKTKPRCGKRQWECNTDESSAEVEELAERLAESLSGSLSEKNEL